MHYPRVSLYALMLAAAGIPLYIHLPRFAAVNLGVELGAIGAILLAIRLVDLVQDPAIGWAIDRWPNHQSGFAALAALGLAFGFPLLFNLSPGDGVLVQLTVILILLFSAYSLGMILIYGRTETFADGNGSKDMMRVAAFREGGMLAGVVLAAVAPAILAGLGAGEQGYPAFGWLLGAIAILVAILTRPLWQRSAITGAGLSFSGLGQSGALRLLGLALVNSLPVALTSTLFLFFVEDRLQLPNMAGPLLVLFFVSAGVSVPFWVGLSNKIGPRRVMLVAMPLAVGGFIGAGFLNAGHLIGFAFICAASGAAVGADMVVLPAMFAVTLSRAGLNAGAAFGLWSFAGKFGLALAAFIALPVLGRAGFNPGGANSDAALNTLNFAYAFVPCGLKLVALGFVWSLPTSEA